EYREVDSARETRGGAQHALGFFGKAADGIDHERNDVLGNPGAVDIAEIPLPFAAIEVEDQQAGAMQEAKKLLHEERIAGSLLPHDLRERASARSRAT